MTLLFEPKDLTPDDEARSLLEQRWIDRSQVPWLTEALRPLKPLRYRDDAELHLKSVAESLIAQIDAGDTAGVVLTKFIVELQRDHPEDRDSHSKFTTIASANGVDFSGALIGLKPRRGALTRLAAARALLTLGASLNLELDPGWLSAAEAAAGAYPKTWGGDEERSEEQNPRGFTFQLLADVESALDHAAQLLERTADDALAKTAKALLTGIGRFASSTSRQPKAHPTTYREMDAALQPGAARLFGLMLTRAHQNESLWRQPLFVEVVFRLWWIAFDGKEQETPAGMRKVLIDNSKRELGRLRAELMKLQKEDAPAFFEQTRDHVEAASRVLFTLASLWDGMKPLLLLMRHSPIPLVDTDLSWWTAKGIMANNAVGSVASHLMWSFQAFARYEQGDDKDLLALRTEIARFCVERCKTNKDRGAPTEPHPVWRIAAIRALGELGVNPDGKGHRLIHFVEENDPDAEVRAAAKVVYARVREKRALAEGLSPRRAVLHALWWFRQAHLTALGVDVDVDGAQRTRAEEARFTTKGLTD